MNNDNLKVNDERARLHRDDIATGRKTVAAAFASDLLADRETLRAALGGARSERDAATVREAVLREALQALAAWVNSIEMKRLFKMARATDYPMEELYDQGDPALVKADAALADPSPRAEALLAVVEAAWALPGACPKCGRSE